MNSQEILSTLKTISVSVEQYEMFSPDNICYFGKDIEGNISFMIPSQYTRIAPMYQETRSLRFAFNKKCTFRSAGTTETKVVHLLTCKEKDDDKALAFIRLTKAFSQNERDNDQYYLAKLFSAISALFDKKRVVSEKELQGLFAELYTILHFGKNDCDISRFWQSRNMMKFDFSISEEKRLEIKSTLKSNRTHHFKHDQLLDELYDIRIVSFLMRKGDYGISLQNLLDRIRDEYADNYALLMHIEELVVHADQDQLCGIKYDEIHLKNNLKYYDAKEIPHFNEKSPDGVFNAEYDCCLDTSPALQEEDIFKWIKEG